MIRIVGCETGPEADAAEEIKKKILAAWPWAELDSGTAIFLIPNVQCFGENPQDIDLVILASLPPEKATFSPTLPLRLQNDAPVEADTVHVETLCLVIEIKDHSPGGIRFNGSKVEVCYRSVSRQEIWHSASQQNEKQKYSLMAYLKRNMPGVPIPYITNLIWLRNVKKDSFPDGTHNLLPATVTWSGLLNSVAGTARLWTGTAGVTLSATPLNSTFSFSKASDLLARKITPTQLDRKRMDRIANAEIQEAWLESLGKRELIFEGRGGTGKTVILLGLAWRMQEEHGARVLLLTYNRALVADLRRLLCLMGLTDEIGRATIEIQTIHAYLFRFLTEVGLLDQEETDFLKDYDKLKEELLGMMQSKTLTTEDIEEVAAKSPESLGWDYVLVDEAQDWPSDERDILHRIYSPPKFVIADGRDQMVRRDGNCDWTKGDSPIPNKRFQLHRGLRMKANLARFANQLAEEIDLPAWSIKENEEAVGGKVIVVEGSYEKAQEFNQELVQQGRKAGNAPVDMLTCIPPGMVLKDEDGKRSVAAEWFDSWGFQVWDGVREDLRRTFPTSSEQMRIVQYDSCRGLEGWTVINLHIDEFYEYKIASWEKMRTDSSENIVDEPLLARRFAARWLMIPCSRAIDTLVLNIRSRKSLLGQALQNISEKCTDFVEWVEL